MSSTTPLASTQDPVPARTVTIHVSRQILSNSKQMQQVTANALRHLGCEACHSGIDLRFKELSELVVNPQTLDVQYATR